MNWNKHMEEQAFWGFVMCELLYSKACLYCLGRIGFVVDRVLYWNIGLSS